MKRVDWRKMDDLTEDLSMKKCLKRRSAEICLNNGRLKE